jgi:hypothetical protein
VIADHVSERSEIAAGLDEFPEVGTARQHQRRP